VIELKWNHTANAAIQQIKENGYQEVTERLGDDILLLDISYHEKSQKHTCVIEKFRR